MLSYKYAKFKENPCVGTDVSTPLGENGEAGENEWLTLLVNLGERR